VEELGLAGAETGLGAGAGIGEEVIEVGALAGGATTATGAGAGGTTSAPLMAPLTAAEDSASPPPQADTRVASSDAAPMEPAEPGSMVGKP
jgi:hypothetical protein